MLRVDGNVATPRTFHYDDLAALPGQIEDIGKLIPGREGGGVLLAAILDAVKRDPKARFAKLASTDGGFVAWVPIDAVAESGVVVYRIGQEPLPADKGGPMRFYIPNVEKCGVPGLDTCANLKSLGTITVTHNAGGAI